MLSRLKVFNLARSEYDKSFWTYGIIFRERFDLLLRVGYFINMFILKLERKGAIKIPYVNIGTRKVEESVSKDGEYFECQNMELVYAWNEMLGDGVQRPTKIKVDNLGQGKYKITSYKDENRVQEVKSFIVSVVGNRFKTLKIERQVVE